MPPQITAPNLLIPVEPLTQNAFAAFGTVIENPEHDPTSKSQLKVVKANQGTALKYIDVSHVTNYYNLAPSKKPARAVMNMFVCSPRQLMSALDGSISGPDSGPAVGGDKSRFPVDILERHPFTPQTFIPLGLSPEDKSTVYLVVVAPTLPVTSKGSNRSPPYPQQAPRRRRSVAEIFTGARPSLFTNTNNPPSFSGTAHGPQRPKGPGEPDLTRLKAFIASGSQAVTYGPGTWHAPMVVLGAKSIDFAVIQYANDVSLEDCQEIEIRREQGADGLNVVIGSGDFAGRMRGRARL